MTAENGKQASADGERQVPYASENKKPPLGQPPAAVLQAQEVEIDYSPAVSAVARLLVEESNHGLTSDPKTTIGKIAAAAELILVQTFSRTADSEIPC